MLKTLGSSSKHGYFNYELALTANFALLEQYFVVVEFKCSADFQDLIKGPKKPYRAKVLTMLAANPGLVPSTALTSPEHHQHYS